MKAQNLEIRAKRNKSKFPLNCYMNIRIELYPYFYVMLNLFQHLINDNQPIINKTLKQVQGDDRFSMDCTHFSSLVLILDTHHLDTIK